MRRASPDGSADASRRPNKRWWRKKPIEVAAVRWTGDNPADVIALLDSDDAILNLQVHIQEYQPLVVRTVDDNVVEVPVGAFIVLDAKGFPYPCDAEIFEATHDLIEREVGG